MYIYIYIYTPTALLSLSDSISRLPAVGVTSGLLRPMIRAPQIDFIHIYRYPILPLPPPIVSGSISRLPASGVTSGILRPMIRAPQIEAGSSRCDFRAKAGFSGAKLPPSVQSAFDDSISDARTPQVPLLYIYTYIYICIYIYCVRVNPTTLFAIYDLPPCHTPHTIGTGNILCRPIVSLRVLKSALCA